MKKSSDPIKRIELRYLNRDGVKVSKLNSARSVRLSIYFDEFSDNHHLEFVLPGTRHETAVLLQKVSRLIVGTALIAEQKRIIWECPDCKYLMSDEQYQSAKFKLCGRCGSLLSDYRRV